MTNKKNIRILHTEWSDGWGGQEIRIINEMKAIRHEGVEVFLACKNSSMIKKMALKEKIKVFILPFRGNVDIETVFLLKRIIHKNSIDIVNTHSGKDTWVGGIAAKFAGIKFIRTRHLSNKIKSSRLNFINELADYVFSTGEKVRADMIKYNRIDKNKIKSIPTGIDETIFNPEIYERDDCRKKLKLNNNEIGIGILAVLRQFKRHDLFLEMAKILVKKFPEKKLVFFIAGDGPQKEKIKKIIIELNLASYVRLEGYVENVPEFLSAIDILVLSSDSKEGVPQSIMQGLFMNKQVVATNSGSTSDLFHENNFQLIEKSSIKALVDGVSYYLNNTSEISSRQFMLNNFSSSVMVNKILSSYQTIL
jgi:glycosyltransferase involved in cell wall biosynthesis